MTDQIKLTCKEFYTKLEELGLKESKLTIILSPNENEEELKDWSDLIPCTFNIGSIKSSQQEFMSYSTRNGIIYSYIKAL